MAITITVKKQCCLNNTVLVDQIRAGVRQAFAIVHAIRPNSFTSRVGKQWKLDAVFFSESLQDINRIVADADKLRVRTLDFRQTPLQFDQLLFAKRSPVSGSIEDQRNLSISK